MAGQLAGSYGFKTSTHMSPMVAVLGLWAAFLVPLRAQFTLEWTLVSTKEWNPLVCETPEPALVRAAWEDDGSIDLTWDCSQGPLT